MPMESDSEFGMIGRVVLLLELSKDRGSAKSNEPDAFFEGDLKPDRK